ncbi:spore coat protein CotJB [Hazenella coriacea]|uniref:Spore coat protein JB n=1 Tax=Hazenella coriacea TaxID=1179467 RepID=A0A4R3LBQ3_9BACL|nr:spore coat protein CotJB [Hazenella coriacea]TCS94946.1 spore coat protein JB [Hazenella coriacea]
MGGKSQFRLLRKLQEVDFVLLELNLYLDTHPNDLKALQQFNHLSQKREQIREKYESKYGPLYNYGLSKNRYPKGWSEGPWPWEM